MTSSRRHNDHSLDPHRRPSVVDDYTATSVYSEIVDTVYEPASVVAGHADNGHYDVLCTRQRSQRGLTTVPVYISLLSDAQAEETYINHPSTVSSADNQLSDTSETHTV